MTSRTIIIAAGALAVALAAPATQALAGQHGHVTFGRGWRGAGFSSRQVDRTATGASVTRNLQTTNGRGAHETRNASYSDGAYQSSKQIQYDNGKTASRNIAAQNNGDGTASVTRTVTNVDGVSHSNSRTVPYPP